MTMIDAMSLPRHVEPVESRVVPTSVHSQR